MTLRPLSSSPVPLAVEFGVPLIDSRVVAEYCQVQHKPLRELVTDHLETIEASFGKVRFETAPSNAKGGGGDGQRFALLTENQATFLVTLTRNTEPVIKFKAALVKAFSEARRQLAEPSAPRTLTRLELLEMALESEKRAVSLQVENASLVADVERMRPKSEIYDCAMTSQDTILVRDAAKLLHPDIPGGLGEKRLFRWMRKNGWLFGENRPYQDKLDDGYLRQRVRPVATDHGTKLKYTPRVTPKGLVKLRALLLAEHAQATL